MNASMEQHSSASPSLSEFHDGNRADQTTPERYLELAIKCMQKVHSATSPQIHLGLCEYLSHKLRLAIEKAQDCNPSGSLQFTEGYHGTFRLLFRLAKEVESFIHACCIDRWSIQHIVMFTSASKYVSLVGDELNFCRRLLRYAKDGQVCPPSVYDLFRFRGDAEAVTLEDRAMRDQERLSEKLNALIQSSDPRTLECKLATYLLGRLIPDPTMCIPGSGGLSSSTSFWEMDYGSLEQVENVGTGGAGIVHKTRWLGELVAEKTFFGSDNPSFRNEVMILAGFSHPNIVPLFGYAMDRHQCSIMMELMEGDLFHLMRSRLRRDRSLDSPFTIYEVVDIISQVAEGMYYLHQNKVVHRDLKSQNILVKSAKDVDMEYVHVKVTDFGLSKIKEMSSTFSNQTLNTGTTRWMAPELIPHHAAHNQGGISTFGEAKKHPFKSDVYSFAMVCYEILTGEVPFQTTSNLRDVKRMVLNGERPKLPNICPSILKTLIEDCWTSDASTRPSFDSICIRLKTLKCFLMADTEEEKPGALVSLIQAPPPFPSNRDWESELHWAVWNDDVGRLRNLLKQDKNLVNASDYDNRTPLHIAAAHDCVSVAKVLVSEGAALNAKDRWGNSPRDEAESAGYKEMVKLLRDCGAEAHGGSMRCHAESLIQAPPPLPSNRDWEIAPSEIELESSELIGKGSFGEIRKALWRGTPVAVKTIRPSLSNDKMAIKNFQHEIQLLVKVRHPNIVQFLGAATRQKPLMLVTEFLAGGNLHELLHNKKETLTPDRIVKYALDIARGMSYLHNRTKPIIHRDLKPRSIFLDEDHKLKVGDFGLSKLVNVQHMHDGYKMTGETGRYRYMAPEVFEHSRYDKSVDVFSFAMILYEMFEGLPPFADKEAYEAATLVATDGLRPMMMATYPPRMVGLICRCWSAYTPKRPPFDSIVEELETMLEEITVAPKDRRYDIYGTLFGWRRNQQRR